MNKKVIKGKTGQAFRIGLTPEFIIKNCKSGGPLRMVLLIPDSRIKALHTAPGAGVIKCIEYHIFVEVIHFHFYLINIFLAEVKGIKFQAVAGRRLVSQLQHIAAFAGAVLFGKCKNKVTVIG